jgi:hypothetical protein
MARVSHFQPATLRRAFFVFSALAVTFAFAGPPPTATPPPLAQVGKPDAAEAARILDQFRHSGWVGYVEFDLHALPRRGDETVYHGRLWGGWAHEGAVTRIEVADGKGAVNRLLLLNGAHAAVWRLVDAQAKPVEGSALFAPLIPGVETTAFDLQMPYLYWPDATVESVTRVRGRPAYEFVFHPPAAIAADRLQVAVVHAYFDAQFNAPVQIELGDTQRITKTTSLVDLKKIGEQWIPKSFDVRNEVTRDKTRFQVTAVALNLEFPSSVFAPASLAQPVPPPPADRIVRIEP